MSDYDAGYAAGMHGLPCPHDQSDEWVRGFEDGVDALIASVTK